MTDIPEWAKTQADQVGEQIYGRHERGWVSWPLITEAGPRPETLIALALVEAEKRGIERAAKVAEDREAICADAVAKVKSGELYQGIPTALASEGCAHLEASHIARTIRQLAQVRE